MLAVCRFVVINHTLFQNLVYRNVLYKYVESRFVACQHATYMYLVGIFLCLAIYQLLEYIKNMHIYCLIYNM